MLESLRAVKRRIFEIPSWRFNKPILVLESDDWGSIRMSSREGRDKLKALGHDIDSNAYQLYDGLETNKDIIQLAKVLNSVKNSTGNSAVFTMNYCAANPDFKKIKESKFNEYHRESFDQTYQVYGQAENVIEEVKKGENAGVFEVQFHGTEHLNIKRWMEALQNDNASVRQAFDVGVFSPSIAKETGYTMEYMDALDYESSIEVKQQVESLEKGLETFIRVWNKKPTSFIAPCYRWSKGIEKFLAKKSIKFIQGQRAQLHPKEEVGYSQKKIFHYTGQRNKLGQIYTVRNVIFEPTLHGPEQALLMAKKQIQLAFRLKVPAIVSTHRINYTSRLDQQNGRNGVSSLKDLLDWVLREYPDVQFLSSSKLGELIQNSKKQCVV
ncbi:MAG: hypothetical protein ACJA2N_000598 [Salibacteraceae bacterium]|jgi:hypothetical protein